MRRHPKAKQSLQSRVHKLNESHEDWTWYKFISWLLNLLLLPKMWRAKKRKKDRLFFISLQQRWTLLIERRRLRRRHRGGGGRGAEVAEGWRWQRGGGDRGRMWQRGLRRKGKGWQRGMKRKTGGGKTGRSGVWRIGRSSNHGIFNTPYFFYKNYACMKMEGHISLKLKNILVF